MSAATASSIDLATVLVRMLDEGTDVWRPVKAMRLGETTYQIADDPVPDDESWVFQPGDIVVVERRNGEGGEDSLVAVAQATHFDERSWASRRRFG